MPPGKTMCSYTCKQKCPKLQACRTPMAVEKRTKQRILRTRCLHARPCTCNDQGLLDCLHQHQPHLAYSNVNFVSSCKHTANTAVWTFEGRART